MHIFLYSTNLPMIPQMTIGQHLTIASPMTAWRFHTETLSSAASFILSEHCLSLRHGELQKFVWWAFWLAPNFLMRRSGAPRRFDEMPYHMIVRSDFGSAADLAHMSWTVCRMVRAPCVAVWCVCICYDSRDGIKCFVWKKVSCWNLKLVRFPVQYTGFVAITVFI